MLQGELRDLELQSLAERFKVPIMDVSLSGAPVRGGRITAEFYGTFLNNWQWLYSSLGQAATGRPTNRGIIPKEVAERTQLEVVATSPGSFVTRLSLNVASQTNLPQVKDLALQAFDELETLLASGAQRDRLQVVMLRLKGRVLSAYANMAELMHKNQVSLGVRLAQPGAPIRSVGLPASVAAAVVPLLDQIAKVDTTPVSVIGVLNAANRRTGKFEIDLGDEGTISGEFDIRSGMVDGKTIGSRYRFDLTEVVSRDQMTGHVDTSFTMDRVIDID